MKYINTFYLGINETAFYFALEEYLVKDYDCDEDIFLFWSVKPTVLIGRHQATLLEINKEYVLENDIDVIRRRSGGGTVYTDKGCMQFSFITKKQNKERIFKEYVSHIIKAINELGVKAYFHGRNDILLEGRKFSGNAIYTYRDKMVTHGTLLFESNLENLVCSLTPDKTKLAKNLVKSVSARVCNIGEEIDMDIDSFSKYICDYVKDSEIEYSSLDHNKINEYKKIFESDDWNYGESPHYKYEFKGITASGNIKIRLSLQEGVIERVKIEGDFFALQDMSVLEESFKGLEFTYSVLLKHLSHVNIGDYILHMSITDFLELCFSKKERYLRKPRYLRIDKKNLNKNHAEVEEILRKKNVFTVCNEASCPNLLECYSKKTATFMILGNVCTRKCSFCDVTTGNPMVVDDQEPNRILESVKKLGLKYVVITSVARDDLEDEGALQFAKVIKILKENLDIKVEVLIPDFNGKIELLQIVVDALPDVINHNVETVPRLNDHLRHRATYKRSLELLKNVKKLNNSIITKSGIMVGVGETNEEVYKVMDDLRSIDVDIMTIGQYLQPSNDHYLVREYVSMEQFKEYEVTGLKKGFNNVFSGPLVRSSYHASEQYSGGVYEKD